MCQDLLLPLAHPKQECLVDVPRTHRGEGSSSSLDLTPAAAKTENKKGHSVRPVHPPAPRRLVGNLRSPLRSDSDGGQRERERRPRGEIEMSAKKPLRWRQKHRLCQRQRSYRHPSAAVRERRGERSSRTRNTNPIRNLLRLPSGYKSGTDARTERHHKDTDRGTSCRSFAWRPPLLWTDASLELYRTFRSLRSPDALRLRGSDGDRDCS